MNGSNGLKLLFAFLSHLHLSLQPYSKTNKWVSPNPYAGVGRDFSNNTMNKRLAYIFAILILVLLVLHLQHVQRYLFYFREQMMMFLYDPSIIADR